MEETIKMRGNRDISTQPEQEGTKITGYQRVIVSIIYVERCGSSCRNDPPQARMEKIRRIAEVTDAIMIEKT